jgi:hypothetical protein
MAEANTSSTQQAADAQHVDNMTSMQQSTPDAPSGARSDAPVQTNNVGAQDGPSQLNSNPTGNSAANNNLGGSLQNTVINGSSFGSLGVGARPGGGDAIGGGGALNSVAGNGGDAGNAGREGGQGSIENAGGAGDGSAGGGNSAPGTGARVAAGFGGGGAGDVGGGEGATTGATTGGGEGGGEGGGTPPPTTASAPISPTSTIIPLAGLTAEESSIAAVDAPTESNSSGQPIPKTQYSVGQLVMVPPVCDCSTSSDYGFTPLSNIAGANGQLNIDINGVWYYTLAALPSPGSGILTDTFRLAFNYQFRDPEIEPKPAYSDLTGYINLTVNVDSSSDSGRLIYSTTATYSADSPESLAPTFELSAVTRINSLSATTDHINLLAQGIMSGLTEVNSSAPGNIGELTADNFGRYIYSINQVSVDSIGQYTSATPLRYDTRVLENFTTLFYQGSDHTDTFNVTTIDGSDTVEVKIGNAIIGTVINDKPGGINYFTLGMMDEEGVLGLPGSENFQIISGADSSNFYATNIGSLTLDADGSYTYVITPAAVSAWESRYVSIASHVDTFLVSYSVGNTLNIQALEFNILQESNTQFIGSSVSTANGKVGGEIFLFDYGIPNDSSDSYSHVITGFQVSEDRINISKLLTSSSDLLSGTIYYDPTDWNLRSEIRVNHSGSDFTVIEIEDVAASIPELMWNDETRSGPVTSLNAVTSWTETINLSGVSYDAFNKKFTTADGWAMKIVSGEFDPSSDADTLVFAGGAGEVEISQTIDGFTDILQDISHIDRINWSA